MAAWTTECSTFEGNGTTEAELRACALAADAGKVVTLTVDGQPVPVTEVETGLLRQSTSPLDNIFGVERAAAIAKAAIRRPRLGRTRSALAPGTHTIEGIGSTV